MFLLTKFGTEFETRFEDQLLPFVF